MTKLWWQIMNSLVKCGETFSAISTPGRRDRPMSLNMTVMKTPLLRALILAPWIST